VTSRRLLLILLSPLWLSLACLGLIIGLIGFSGTDIAAEIIAELYTGSPEGEQLAYLAIRALLLPFQLIFIAIVIAAVVWVFRRRGRIGAWILGEPITERLAGNATAAETLPAVLRPSRRRTLQQLFSSIVVVIALGTAAFLIFGQFIDRADLAVVIAALTSSLAWGARLPIGDILGGISNIFESNLAVGDRIQYRQVDRVIDGIVENVDLRFLSVRALSGELTTIPFGELRVFRNLSRGEYIGVYAGFPVASGDLARAVALLTELAPESPALLPQLVEPWQPMSLDGQMGAVIDLVLFGKTEPGGENDLQLALHKLVQERLADAGIPLSGKEAGVA
jgi:small-conductance mechanosensitive channel